MTQTDVTAVWWRENQTVFLPENPGVRAAIFLARASLSKSTSSFRGRRWTLKMDARPLISGGPETPEHNMNINIIKSVLIVLVYFLFSVLWSSLGCMFVWSVQIKLLLLLYDGQIRFIFSEVIQQSLQLKRQHKPSSLFLKMNKKTRENKMLFRRKP